MGQNVMNRQILSNIPLANVTSYLLAHSWQEVDENAAGSYWAQFGQDNQPLVWLPKNAQVKTFVDRVAQLIQVIAKVEDRDADDLVRDLLDLQRDIQEVRTFPSGTPGSMSLSASSESVQGLRKWIESSAVAVAIRERSAVLPRRRPPEATALVAATEMLTPVPGSFIWRLSVPVSDHPFPDQYPFALPGADLQLEDYSRRTTLHLLRSTTATVSAATEVLDTDTGIDAFKSRIQEGVTADLCEALAQTSVDGLTPLEFNFKWSVRRPPSGVTNSALVVSQEQIEVITWAGRQLRQEAIEEDVTVSGLVVRLSRTGPSDTPGKITIAGADKADPGGPLAHYWVELSAEDYHRAAEAHADYLEVDITGDLKRTARRRDLLNPRNFRILASTPD